MDRTDLERKRAQLLRDLPPLDKVLRASLFERRRRCGKANCRCADSEAEGHPVVCLSRSIGDGKSSQITLPKRLVPVAEAWLHNYRRWLEAVEEISEINHELLRRRWVEPPPEPGDPGG